MHHSWKIPVDFFPIHDVLRDNFVKWLSSLLPYKRKDYRKSIYFIHLSARKNYKQSEKFHFAEAGIFHKRCTSVFLYDQFDTTCNFRVIHDFQFSKVTDFLTSSCVLKCMANISSQVYWVHRKSKLDFVLGLSWPVTKVKLRSLALTQNQI